MLRCCLRMYGWLGVRFHNTVWVYCLGAGHFDVIVMRGNGAVSARSLRSLHCMCAVFDRYHSYSRSRSFVFRRCGLGWDVGGRRCEIMCQGACCARMCLQVLVVSTVLLVGWPLRLCMVKWKRLSARACCLGPCCAAWHYASQTNPVSGAGAAWCFLD